MSERVARPQRRLHHLPPGPFAGLSLSKRPHFIFKALALCCSHTVFEQLSVMSSSRRTGYDFFSKMAHLIAILTFATALTAFTKILTGTW